MAEPPPDNKPPETEATLRRANEILSRSPAVAFIWKNAEGWPVDYVSDNVHTLFGWQQNDFITGRVPYAQVVHPDDLPRVQKEVLRASIDPATFKFRHEPYRILHRDGSVKWVDDFTTILREKNGSIVAYEGILLDITDRKLMEERLRLIESAINQAVDGIALNDANGRFIYVNDTKCSRLGYSREELTDLSVFDVDPAITPENWLDRWETLRKAGTLTFETKHRTKYGEFIPVELAARLIEFNDNEFGFSTSRVITGHKRAETSLPLSPESSKEISFEDLFDLKDIQRLQDQFAEATGVASIITHTDGTPITKPSSFCRLCSDIIRNTEKGRANCYKSDAALGQVRPDGPIIQPCMSSGLWDAGAGVTVGGRHIANWLIGQVRDETQTDASMLAYAREIGADEKAFLKAFHEVPAMSRESFTAVARVLHTLANQLSEVAYQNVQQTRFIAERKRAEKEKESLQSQILHAQKLESVGRLAGGVAHDLNNLLAPITSYSEMLMDDFGTGDLRRESVQNIFEAGLRARDIVRQLLTFSRKQTMEVKPVNLNDILARFEKLLRRTIRKDIQILIKPNSSLPSIMGDMGQLEQMVMNMAVNAQYAMPDGGLLTMETAMVTLEDEDLADRQELKKGAYVMLTISDTGHGMDEEIKLHIFEPFFSTKGKHGTGLGLSTVYGIVKQHGGDIHTYSEPGTGTTFKIHLPVTQDTTVEEPLPEPMEALRGFETILLVEDNDRVRGMTENILSRRGYHVLSAENAEKALELHAAHAGPIHLLLTDIVMPGMNGKELFEEVRKVQPDIPVLYMSGYTDAVIAHHGVLSKGTNLIQKPFSVRGLATKIRESLD